MGRHRDGRRGYLNAGPGSTTGPVRGLIDCHVHLAALDDGRNGCHISPALARGLAGKLLQRLVGLRITDPPAQANRKYLERLLRLLKSGQTVRRAVVLALDAVHDEAGQRDLEASALVVSNDYALQAAREHPESLLPAASVHPYRRDALEELARVRQAGAVLNKLLPTSQRFDPADARLGRYWRTCADLGLPVLVHTGREYTLKGHDQRYGDPSRLEPALDQGASVIAAHACSYGFPIGERYLGTFRRLVASYPNFLADASALTLPGRVPMLWRIAREPDLAARLVFATDYPLPVTILPLIGRCSPVAVWRIARLDNPFERAVAVMRALRVEPRSDSLIARMPGQAEGS